MLLVKNRGIENPATTINNCAQATVRSSGTACGGGSVSFRTPTGSGLRRHPQVQDPLKPKPPQYQRDSRQRPKTNAARTITVQWTPLTTNATGYRIRYRSQDTSGGFTPSWRTTSVQGRTTRTKDIPSLTINTTGNPSYEFQIQGVNGSKRSNYSSSATAIPNKQCSTNPATCGTGTIQQTPNKSFISADAICQYTNSQSCPTPPTIQDPTYQVNNATCDINTTFQYSGGNIFRTSVTNKTTTIHSFPLKTYEGITNGTEVYTLKPIDYNQTYALNVETRNTDHPNTVWSNKTTKQFTTPTTPHPKSSFTVQGSQNTNSKLTLRYTNPTNRTLNNIRFNWTFSETPTFHNNTNQNSINPIVSFQTTGQKTIHLQVTDDNIPTTQNKACSTTQTVSIGNNQNQATQQTMRAPTIDRVEYQLANNSCIPTGKLIYTSQEPERTDILQIFSQQDQVYAQRHNISQPSTRHFTFPINPNTEYTADITTYDFRKNPTKSPSRTTTYTFVTPPTATFPTANFNYTTDQNKATFTYAGTDSIQWFFSETPTYLQGTSTSNHIQVQFPTYGNKTITLRANSSATELNSCVNTKTINLQPDPQQYIIPKVREVPPTPLR